MDRERAAPLDAEHFRAIADYTYDWETWVGPDGVVRWINPAVERITGYSVTQCLELADYPLELVYEADRAIVLQVMDQARAGASGNHVEFRVARKDGSIVWAAISWQPLVSRGGEHLGYRSSVRDIHAHKQLEAELERALVRAESASLAKSEFLANVSHELCTPLQSILGYAQLLHAAELEQPLDGYVRTLLDQGELLDRLVSDLLDYSSLQAGLLPLRAEAYSPRELVDGVIRALAPLALKKGLVLESRQLLAPERCVGDAVRVSQVLGNLVSNAIKFTAHGRVAVTLDSEGQGRGYRVTVEDTGPGLPDDDSLFLPFQQGRAPADGAARGVGLGLAISRQLCERMGGSLERGAAPAQGARLVACFPDHAPGASLTQVEHFEHDEPPTLVSRSFATRHPLAILVVDDMRPAREFLEAALVALGYEPGCAGSGAEAFERVSAQSYDLVLVDLQMPEIDGWSAARGLRDRLGSRPFIVALTANALAKGDARLGQAGFDGFAQKPLRLRELQALLIRAHARSGDRFRDGVENGGGSELDADRLAELGELRARDGESLLARMCDRVLGALPDARARAQAAASGPELARALHDLRGLLSLIGARSAAELLGRAEQAAEELGQLDPAVWTELQRRLEAVHRELRRRRPSADTGVSVAAQAGAHALESGQRAPITVTAARGSPRARSRPRRRPPRG
jgi:PAS domain S-box-containing protein